MSEQLLLEIAKSGGVALGALIMAISMWRMFRQFAEEADKERKFHNDRVRVVTDSWTVTTSNLLEAHERTRTNVEGLKDAMQEAHALIKMHVDADRTAHAELKEEIKENRRVIKPSPPNSR